MHQHVTAWLPLTCTVPSQRSHKGALPRDGCKEAADVLAPHPSCCSCLPILILNGLLREVGACESAQHCLQTGKDRGPEDGLLSSIGACESSSGPYTR